MKPTSKLVWILTSQVRKVDVKLPKKHVRPHKITDDNQSIHNGVIHEKLHTNLRSTG